MAEIGVGVLRGLHVLVVEDEPLLSMALIDELEPVGAIVVGPAASVEGALDLLATTPVDAAILDFELQGKFVHPVADLLVERDVPFILTTGHDAEMLPERYALLPNSAKPALATDVLAALAARIAER
jgi:DNA-binding NarL/FixJ family response regulator